MMTINQKIAKLLNRIHHQPAQTPINLSIYLRELDSNQNELDELIKRLLEEGLVEPAVMYGNNYYFLTLEGKRMGMLDSYLDRQSKKDEEIIKLKEIQSTQIEREAEDRKSKKLDRYITIISVLGTLAVSIWNTALNNDMNDVLQNMDTIKMKVDSLRYEIKLLKLSQDVSISNSTKKSQSSKITQPNNKKGNYSPRLAN